MKVDNILGYILSNIDEFTRLELKILLYGLTYCISNKTNQFPYNIHNINKFIGADKSNLYRAMSSLRNHGIIIVDNHKAYLNL